jgi:acyl-CoA reductase-like NAD-dependent aldehyde dehydrogenase
MTEHSTLQTINPATGEALQPHAYQSETQVETLLASAATAARDWGHTRCADRAAVLHEVARLLRQERSTLAQTISTEMGKPIVEAEGEIEKSAWNCEYVAANAESWLADEIVPTNAALSYVAHRPLGVVLAILPWNFPVWQVFRCAVSALMAGNTFVLKHAPNVPECAASVTRLLSRAGVPTGVFQNLTVPVPRIAHVISDVRVAAVAFTGSPTAGAAVAARAGASCKKSILELGGSDAFIVLDDADLEGAVAAAVRGRFANCGQVCLAAKRFIVTDGVRAEFEARFEHAIANLRVGDPLDRATQMGPMARADLRNALDAQVQRSIQKGARLVLGGHALQERGYYYAPTLLVDTDASMDVVAEETFGPVAPVIRARDAADAARIANASPYGLAAVIWTRDVERARALAVRLEVGSVFINGVTASDPRLPVGGVKLSGYGRELGAAGMRELVNVQSVWIGPG